MSFLASLLALDPAAPLDAAACSGLLRQLEAQMKSGADDPEKPMRIQGQDALLHRLAMAVVLNEHVLLEGLPGVAKTTAVELLSRDTGLTCRRVQFVPDMQPSDLIGRDQINLSALSGAAHGAQDHLRYWENGPLFQNIVIIDEINRAPSKVQAALLESMAERAITPFGKTRFVIRSRREWRMWLRWVFSHPAYRQSGVWGGFWEACRGGDELPGSAMEDLTQAASEQRWDLFGPDFPWQDRAAVAEGTLGASPIDLRSPRDSQFTVFATMNPIEMEGTYPLSEAQTDRFCFKTLVRYPPFDALRAITSMINPPSRGADPDERILGDPDAAREALRRSLYFFRRCREVMFGPPGRQENSLLARLTADQAGGGGDGASGVLELITRLVFFSHLQQPEEGGRRAQQLARILKDPEQIERQARLLREDERFAVLLENRIWQYVLSGASPRAQMFLAKAAVCEMLLEGDTDADERHVREVAHDILRHRIRLNVQARVRGIRSEDVVDALLQYLAGAG